MMKKVFLGLFLGLLICSVSYAQTAPIVNADTPLVVEKSKERVAHKPKASKKPKKKHVVKKPKESKSETLTDSTTK